MNAGRRNGIIVLMILALGGIISFQAYWIKTAMDQNRVQFERNVRETLVQVAANLEEKEASQVLANTYIFFTNEPQEIIVKGNRKNDIVINARGGNSRIRATGSGDTITLNRVGHSTSALSYGLRADTFVIDQQGDVNVQRRLEKRVKMVDIAVNKILDDEKLAITQRLDMANLDSILAHALNEKGIDLSYEYAIVDNQGDSQQVVLSNVENPSDNIATSTYQASLFPNDLEGSTHLLAVFFPGQSAFLLRQVGTTLFAGIVCIGIILGCFVYTLRIISRQKKLGEIKNDFINNMTHELKTPIATISLATQVLSENEVIQNPAAIHKYLGVIRDENTRLSHQVERVLQSAQLENQEVDMGFENVRFHDLASHVLETFISVNPDITLTKSFDATSDTVSIDIHHFTNVLNNLLDNAAKYSSEKCHITVTTRNAAERFLIEVRDNGIGMEASQIKYIFDSFYRISTGNLHDTKGFGIGLSYVQHIIHAHDGSISVQSEPGIGSAFIITLSNV